MIKDSILQEQIGIFNVYAPNNTALNYVSQTPIELQGEIDDPAIVVGDFNTLLSEVDSSSSQEIGEQHLNQPDVTDFYRLLHPTAAEYTFLSNAVGPDLFLKLCIL